MYKIIMMMALALSALVCQAEEYKLGDIRIAHPWARATLPGAQVGGVYLQLQNAGKADRLLSAKSDVAETVELHVMSMDVAVMQMRKLDKGVELPSGGGVEFKPRIAAHHADGITCATRSRAVHFHCSSNLNTRVPRRLPSRAKP